MNKHDAEIQGIKEHLETNIARSVSQLFDELHELEQKEQAKTFYDFDCYVGTAWARAEHDDAEAVLEECLLVAGPSHEETLAELEQQVRTIGTLEEYVLVVRRVK